MLAFFKLGDTINDNEEDRKLLVTFCNVTVILQPIDGLGLPITFLWEGTKSCVHGLGFKLFINIHISDAFQELQTYVTFCPGQTWFTLWFGNNWAKVSERIKTNRLLLTI